MKKILLLLTICFFTLAGMAQTKKIAHRSHSGSDQSFSIDGSDNFGLVSPEYRERMKKTDSLMKIKADSVRKAADSTNVKTRPKPKKLKTDPRNTRR